MANYSKIILSGSANGAGIDITGVAPTLGNIIHTAVTGTADSIDEVWLYAYNSATLAREVGIMWGTSEVGNRFTYTVTSTSPEGLHLLCPGLVVKGATNVIKAWVTSGAAGSVYVFGYVNRSAT